MGTVTLIMFLLGVMGVLVTLAWLLINAIRKRNLKKVSKILGGSIALIMFSILLKPGMLSPQAASTSITTTSESVEKEQTQEEINKKLKLDATKADFVEINGYEKENIGKYLFIDGEVSFVGDVNEAIPLFTVTTKEGDGYGIYDVMNFYDIEVKKGDKVKVYGSLSSEKSNVGAPQISGIIIEKQK